jgi:hypothetical protein
MRRLYFQTVIQNAYVLQIIQNSRRGMVFVTLQKQMHWVQLLCRNGARSISDVQKRRKNGVD